jgi:calcineurin-like phosphoesterase family protein
MQIDENTWITSDSHAFHKNICYGSSTWANKETGCRRFDNEFVMTELMAQNINDMVPANGTIIHLGDWSFGGDDKVFKFRDMINCKNIILVRGNHDKHDIYKTNCFNRVYDYLENRELVLFHYPIGSWNGMGRGAINFFGHCHTTFKNAIGRQKDVGMDTNNLKPYHLATLIEEMKKIYIHQDYKIGGFNSMKKL